MNKEGKYNNEYLLSIKRDSPEWKEFVLWQKDRIWERLERYNRVSTAKEQLSEIGKLSNYQQYKINSVTPFLLQALERIENGLYGTCKYCGEEIPVERLLIVAPALQCMKCENKK